MNGDTIGVVSMYLCPISIVVINHKSKISVNRALIAQVMKCERRNYSKDIGYWGFFFLLPIYNFVNSVIQSFPLRLMGYWGIIWHCLGISLRPCRVLKIIY